MAERKSRKLAMAATREALILAGLAEFAEHGLDAPSLDKICARAGFTRGAFYVHFKDREDFIVAVMEWRIRALLDAIMGVEESDTGIEETVRRFVGTVLELIYGAGEIAPGVRASPNAALIQLHRLLDAGERSPLVRSRLVSLFEGAVRRLADMARRDQASGEIRADIDAETVASLLVVVALGDFTALETGLILDSEKMGETLLRLLRRP